MGGCCYDTHVSEANNCHGNICNSIYTQHAALESIADISVWHCTAADHVNVKTEQCLNCSYMSRDISTERKNWYVKQTSSSCSKNGKTLRPQSLKTPLSIIYRLTDMGIRGYDFGVQTTSGAWDYEIFPKIGNVFGDRTASGARNCEISLK